MGWSGSSHGSPSQLCVWYTLDPALWQMSNKRPGSLRLFLLPLPWYLCKAHGLLPPYSSLVPSCCLLAKWPSLSLPKDSSWKSSKLAAQLLTGRVHMEREGDGIQTLRPYGIVKMLCERRGERECTSMSKYVCTHMCTCVPGVPYRGTYTREACVHALCVYA